VKRDTAKGGELTLKGRTRGSSPGRGQLSKGLQCGGGGCTLPGPKGFVNGKTETGETFYGGQNLKLGRGRYGFQPIKGRKKKEEGLPGLKAFFLLKITSLVYSGLWKSCTSSHLTS